MNKAGTLRTTPIISQRPIHWSFLRLRQNRPHPSWKVYDQKGAEKADALPDLTKGQMLPVYAETVRAKDMPKDAERKGIGTTTTRIGIIEKLVVFGLVERRKSKKIANLFPTNTDMVLITVLPEQLQSPQLTAEWEQLKQMEGSELSPESFLGRTAAMLRKPVGTYKPIPGAEVLFPSGREVIGKCPRYEAAVSETPKGFFCEKRI